MLKEYKILKATKLGIEMKRNALEDELKSIKERERKTKKVYNNEIKRKEKELKDMQHLQTEKMKDEKSSKKQFLAFKGRERKRKRNRKSKTKTKRTI